MTTKALTTPVRVLIYTLGLVIVLFGLLFAWRVAGYYRAIARGDLDALPQFSSQLTRGSFAEREHPDAAVVARGDNPALGPADAPTTVVMFADFECPFSKEVFPAARALLSNNPKIKFIFRDFPLESIHPNAVGASKAAHCAGRQEKFWQMHDKLFQNAPKIEPQDLRFYAEQIGLDLASFDACLKDPKTDAAITADLQDGLAAGVRGTPTFFFNGRKVEGAIPFPIFKQLITSITK